MNFTEKNGKLIISREGRIDLSNTADTEKEMLGAVSAHEGMPVVFDAAKLDYIFQRGTQGAA